MIVSGDIFPHNTLFGHFHFSFFSVCLLVVLLAYLFYKEKETMELGGGEENVEANEGGKTLIRISYKKNIQ